MTIISVVVCMEDINAQDESDFYTETIHNHTLQKNLRDDYGVDGTGNSTDSYWLQRAIDEVSAAGGGKIYLPASMYQLKGVILKSNVHILIEANTVITPGPVGVDEKATIFTLGNKTTPVRNVSIRGVGGRYIVNFPGNVRGMTLFGCGDVDNFLLSDFIVNDQFTVYSAIGMSPSLFIEGRIAWPRNGVVKNGTVLDSHYGYGLVQTQAAENVLFKNVHCTGGCTLRVETGWTKMNDLQIGGVDRIFGRNITCSDGHCAVMIAPHSMFNGSVDVDTAISISCSAAVKIGGGYVSKKYNNPDLVPGTFSDVKVRNVDATFGITARLKSQELEYIPTYRQKYLTNISEDGGKSVIGPSIGAIIYGPDLYEHAVEISNVQPHGFLCQPDLILESHKTPGLGCKSVDTIMHHVDTLVTITEYSFLNPVGSAVASHTSFFSADTFYYHTGYIVRTTDTTVTTTDSTIITINCQVTTVDTVFNETKTMISVVDPPDYNIDSVYFNMDTTITSIYSSSQTISFPDTTFNNLDTTSFTTVDTTVTISNTTFLYSTGEAEISGNDHTLRVYPNPAGDKVYLEITEPVQPGASISVYSNSGVLVLCQEIKSGITQLQTSELKSDMYVVLIVNGIKSYSRLFLKK